MPEILVCRHKNVYLKKFLAVFLVFVFICAGLYSEEPAKKEVKKDSQGLAYSRDSGNFNILGLGVIGLSFVGANNKENNGGTGNFLMAAGVVSLIVSGVLNGYANKELAKTEKQFVSFPLPKLAENQPVKSAQIKLEEYKAVKAELANIKGIEIQEGIEVEKIIISANAQSLGFSSREETYFNEVGKENLKEIAATIKKINENKVEVVGYTDDQGAEEQNIRISEARARNVVDFYVQKEGLAEEKFVARGAGSKNPAVNNSDPEKRLMNNRVETIIVSSNISKSGEIKKEVEKLNKIVGVGVTKEVIAEESIVTAGEEAVSFPTDTWTLGQKHRLSLDSIGKMIHSILSDGSECTIRIKGHTDNKGTEIYNNELSKKRANSVIAYFTGEVKIKPDIFEGIGCGFQYPIASNDTEEGRAKNRRVEVVIIKNSKNSKDSK